MFNTKNLLTVMVLCQFVLAVYTACYYENDADCEPNSTEVIDCYDCSCNSDGTLRVCCLNIPTPTGMIPGCVADFDEENCEYNVYDPDSPGKECSVFGAVGR